MQEPSPPPLTAPVSRRRRPQADRREIAAIFVGGALGTLARAALADAFPRPVTAWPWPTFAVNIVAAFLLGYFVTRLTERLPLSSYRRPNQPAAPRLCRRSSPRPISASASR